VTNVIHTKEFDRQKEQNRKADLQCVLGKFENCAFQEIKHLPAHIQMC